LREIAAKDSRVRVIALRRNYGQTPAMSAGIDAARGKVLIPMDAQCCSCRRSCFSGACRMTSAIIGADTLYRN